MILFQSIMITTIQILPNPISLSLQVSPSCSSFLPDASFPILNPIQSPYHYYHLSYIHKSLILFQSNISQIFRSYLIKSPNLSPLQFLPSCCIHSHPLYYPEFLSSSSPILHSLVLDPIPPFPSYILLRVPIIILTYPSFIYLIWHPIS